MRPIGGVNVAALTPHRREGHTQDLGAALELIDFLCGAGVKGIALLGSTGEFLHFSIEDRIRLIYMAVKRSRVPVIAGISHSTLDGALQLGRESCAAGATCLLLMPPYFFRYSQTDIREYYLEFIRQVGRNVPVFLYNIPFFTNEIEVETAAGLLSTGEFAGIKDSSGRFDYFEKLHTLRAKHAFTLLVGNDSVFLKARRAGADGVVSGCGSAIPELLVALDRAITNGAGDTAAALERRLNEFIAWIDGFPTPAGIKMAAAARGLKVGPLAIPPAAETRRRLDEFKDWFSGWLPAVLKECSAG
jgi:4-hydroxy-tetrahydrodipicolinate synthase